MEKNKDKKERERNINVWLPLAHPQLGAWPATQACALTGNRTSNLSVPGALNHTSQGSCIFYNNKNIPKIPIDSV